MKQSPTRRLPDFARVLLALAASTALLAGCGEDQVLQANGAGTVDAADAQAGLDGVAGDDGQANDAAQDATPSQDAGQDAEQDSVADSADAVDPGTDAAVDAAEDAQPLDSQADSSTDTDTGADAGADGEPSDTQSADATDATADAGCQSADQCPAAAGPCLVPVCQAGVCAVVFAADATPCDDGDACTKNDTCQSGSCAAGAPVQCAGDGNVCLTWSCSKATGSCVSLPASATCSDGNACTTSDSCKDGKCEGAVLNCDDANPCTTNTCDPASGCASANNTLPCGTGNLCVKPGVCKDGACAGSAPTDCDDGNPCTVDSCDPTSGVCQFAGSVVGACEDGNPCTAGDTCQKGMCKAGGPKVCNDNNLCTTDTCMIDVGCVFAPITGTCSDGDVCTENDACTTGACKGTAIVCDDGNPCTADVCDKVKGCLFSPNSAPCSTDACHAGTCVQGKCANLIVQTCSDDNICTTDTCDAVTGCAHKVVIDGTPCGVGSKCIEAPLCKAGACQAAGPVSCSDGNACTKDACDPLTGCTWTALSGPCDDGNACTVGEACAQVAGKGFQCTGGTVLDATKACDDKNPCTNESCDPIKGCIHINNVEPCNDANACTTGDTCFAGTCGGTPGTSCDDGNGCTADKCDPATGNCSWAQAVNGTCTDNNPCTTTDTCVGAQCVGSGSLCTDSNPCTTDSCDKATGKCSYTLINCSDGNLCTSDTCDGVTGKCVFANNTLPCISADKCAAAGLCDGKGTCQASGGNKCDDKNPCTADSCEASTGTCKNVPAGDGSACDDGVGCTSNSACTAGKCQSPTGCLGFADALTCPSKVAWTIDVPAPTPPGLPRTVVWAIDGTPNTAADVIDHSCTLNFNNSVNYCDPLVGQPGMCQMPLGSATQPTPANFTTSAGLIPTLIFDAYYDVDTFVAEADQPMVEVLDATTKAVLASQLLPVTASDLKKWKDGYKIAFPAAAGKQVLLRFSLNQPQGTGGSQGNTGTGFFVDNIKFAALPGTEVCDDGLDNDGNFKADCADPACAAVAACSELDCSDGLDNDKDGATDCSDPNCTTDMACGGATLYVNTFECTDKAFSFYASAPPITWAVDSAPVVAKPPTGTCSLNYNNGTNFDAGNSAANAGSAISNFTIDATGKSAVRVDLWGYFDTEQGTGTGTYDRVYLSASTDDFAGCADNTTPSNYTSEVCKTAGTYTAVLEETSLKTWIHMQVPLTGMGGKKFKLRIKFDTGDGIANATAGPFLDDMKVFGL